MHTHGGQHPRGGTCHCVGHHVWRAGGWRGTGRGDTLSQYTQHGRRTLPAPTPFTLRGPIFLFILFTHLTLRVHSIHHTYRAHTNQVFANTHTHTLSLSLYIHTHTMMTRTMIIHAMIIHTPVYIYVCVHTYAHKNTNTLTHALTSRNTHHTQTMETHCDHTHSHTPSLKHTHLTPHSHQTQAMKKYSNDTQGHTNTHTHTHTLVNTRQESIQATEQGHESVMQTTTYFH